MRSGFSMSRRTTGRRQAGSLSDIFSPLSAVVEYRFVPVQPKLPAIGHGVGQLNVHDAGPFPVPAPPSRRMQAPEILGPPLVQMLGNGTFDFPHQSGTSNSHRASWLHKPREVVTDGICDQTPRRTIEPNSTCIILANVIVFSL
jgi:hypothetical protein